MGQTARGISRRGFLCGLAVSPAMKRSALGQSQAPAAVVPRPTAIRIVEVTHEFEDFRYRAPYEFGGRSVDRVTLLNVNLRVRTGDGKEAWGFGSMTLGNAWSFPAAGQDEGLGAMKALGDDCRS